MREASCSCGAVRAFCEGEPGRVSVCHCLHCKKRSGSAFAAQARFPSDQVRLTGVRHSWRRTGEGGGTMDFEFCPLCSSIIAYHSDDQPEWIAIPMGAFADPAFPAPAFSVYEERKHAWLSIEGEGVEHME